MNKNMKVVIFAGGAGSRMSEETNVKPKPMVDICGKPILLHIMEHYASWGYDDFVILGGYKCEYIKDYFLKYYDNNADFTVNLATGVVEMLPPRKNNFKVTILDTGVNTLTGSRLAQAKDFLADKPFMLTYGDGISDINIKELAKEAKTADKILTLSVVSPKMRFGTVELTSSSDHTVVNFHEKLNNHDKINGGFMVVKPEIFEFIPEYNVMFEDVPMQAVTAIGQCHAYIPPANTYWHAIDTLKDKLEVEQHITNNKIKY